MKIVETVRVVNADRTFAGHRDLRMTLDTDTGELKLDAPAMFTDPIVDIGELQQALDRLDVHKEKTDAPHESS